MNIEPQSIVRLLYVPLVLDNKNQLTFENAKSQYDYFQLQTVENGALLYDNFTYIKENNSLKVGININKLYNCNYLMYRNDGFSDKWFYAFITQIKYINENCTEIFFNIDVFQTWQFNFEIKPSFIIREHVEDDTIGRHTIPENLPVVEVIEEFQTSDSSLTDFNYIGILTSWNPAIEQQFSGISIYNRQIFGKQVFVIPANSTNQIKDLLYFVSKTNTDGHIEDIESIFIIPAALINESQLTMHTGTSAGTSFTFYSLPYTMNPESFNIAITKLHQFNDYVPKNNKCFCYPYNYLLVSNNNGSSNIYKYENFSSGSAIFSIMLALSIGISGRVIPLNYKGQNHNDDESLPLGKYPTCGWSGDAYINWLTENAINLPMNISNTIIGSAANLGQSASTGNISNSALSTANSIASIFNQFYQADLAPNLGSSSNTGDVVWSSKRNGFVFHQMRAKTEYLKQIDDFFSMFGYKINLVKIPNLKSRPNWNYIETNNINLFGPIPQDNLLELKSIFDSGVTLWHNPETFGNYNLNNK